MSTRQTTGRQGRGREGEEAAKPRPDLSAIIGGRRPAGAQPAADARLPGGNGAPRATGRPSRVGKSPIPAHLPDAAYKQLRILGIDQNKTVQRMTEEAFNDYFAKHGLPEIAGSTGS